jgi:hypothetical protein
MFFLRHFAAALSSGAVVGMVLAAGCAGEPKRSSKSDDDDGGTNPQTTGICMAACPNLCDDDQDCDLSKGEMCCDFGEHGAICTPAASCPRLCQNDNTCDLAGGEACLRVSLHTTQAICVEPETAVRLCSTPGSDAGCEVGETCCGNYKEPVCMPTHLCPGGCGADEHCDTSIGDVCCTSMPQIDTTLAVPGLCIASTICPRLCGTSSECNTQNGEICCEGVCSTSCAKKCETSSDCLGQVCCKAAAVKSPLFSGLGVIGYPVTQTSACAASSLGSLSPQTVSGVTQGTSQHYSSCGGQNAPESVFSFSAPTAGQYVFATQGTSFDTVLYLRDAACTQELACNDDYDDHTSLVYTFLGQGQIVTVFVDGYSSGSSGSFLLHVDGPF